LQRKLTLTIVVALIAVGVAAIGQTAQASTKHYTFVERGLLCIHGYEGSWIDPDYPYWGGLQMDMNFQRAYGWIRVAKHTSHVHKIYFLRKWGTADNWPIWAQMLAGKHAYSVRGWGPWPKTAHLCGLA
jgi:hypothetical protein